MVSLSSADMERHIKRQIEIEQGRNEREFTNEASDALDNDVFEGSERYRLEVVAQVRETREAMPD